MIASKAIFFIFYHFLISFRQFSRQRNPVGQDVEEVWPDYLKNQPAPQIHLSLLLHNHTRSFFDFHSLNRDQGKKVMQPWLDFFHISGK